MLRLPALAAHEKSDDDLLGFEYEHVLDRNCGTLVLLEDEHGPVVECERLLIRFRTSWDVSTSELRASMVASEHVCPRLVQCVVQLSSTPLTVHAAPARASRKRRRMEQAAFAVLWRAMHQLARPLVCIPATRKEARGAAALFFPRRAAALFSPPGRPNERAMLNAADLYK